MRGSINDRWRCNARLARPWLGSAVAAPALLARIYTQLPPKLLERSRAAASQFCLPQDEIAAAAINRFLIEYGFQAWR